MIRNELAIRRLQRVMKRWRVLHLGLKSWETEGDRLAYLWMQELLGKEQSTFVQGSLAHTTIPDPLEIKDLLPGCKRFYWSPTEYEKKEGA